MSEPGFLRMVLGGPARLVKWVWPSSSGSDARPSPSPSTSARSSSSSSFSPPNPLTYLTSSYLLLSLSLAFVLHRIHHLVPSGLSPSHSPTSPHPTRTRVHSALVQVGIRLPGLLAMLKSLVSLALAAHHGHGQGSVPTWLLRPSSYRRIALVAVYYLTRFSGTTGQLGDLLNLEPPDHSRLLWDAFVAIALSITCEHFVRTVSDDDPSLHQFNLLSFSFLLHVQQKAPGPDHAQLYLYLALTLAELITLQLSYVVPYLDRRANSTTTATTTTMTTRRYRFGITLFYSLVSQALALQSYYLLYSDLHAPLPPASDVVVVKSYSSTDGGGALIWFNKVPEMLFEAIVVASVAIRFAATVVRGQDWNRDNLVGAPPVWWDSTEDYAVVLIKYTTAMLKQTRLSTLSYELSPVSVLPSVVATSLESIGFDLSSSSATTTTTTTMSDEADDGAGGLRVRLERNGDVVLIEELVESTTPNHATNRTRRQQQEQQGLRRRTGPRTSEALEYGFGVEVKRVEIEPVSTQADRAGGITAEWDGEWGSGFAATGVEYEARGGGGHNGEFGISLVQGERRGWIWTFTAVVVRIAFYVGYVAVKSVVDVARGALRRVGLRSLEGRLHDTWTTSTRQTGPDGCRQHNQGGEGDDVGDEDWVPDDDDDASDSSGSGSDDDNDDEAQEEENPFELISDLSHSVTAADEQGPAATYSPTELAPYLLAHHLSPRGTLTRRRYESLLPTRARPDDDDDTTRSSIDRLDSAISRHLASDPRGVGLVRMTAAEREEKRTEWRESRSMFCVVCTVEPRTVILWPCRCLALCESCREALALRTTASTPGAGPAHAAAVPGTGGSLCPTCRVGVAGYSRIYIP